MPPMSGHPESGYGVVAAMTGARDIGGLHVLAFGLDLLATPMVRTMAGAAGRAVTAEVGEML